MPEVLSARLAKKGVPSAAIAARTVTSADFYLVGRRLTFHVFSTHAASPNAKHNHIILRVQSETSCRLQQPSIVPMLPAPGAEISFVVTGHAQTTEGNGICRSEALTSLRLIP